MIPVEEPIVLPVMPISRVFARVVLVLLACLTVLATAAGVLYVLFAYIVVSATGTSSGMNDLVHLAGAGAVLGLLLAVFFAWSAHRLRSKHSS